MAAVLAAWRRGDVRIVPSLAERLKDSDPAVRCAAAYALRRLDAHRAAEPLAALLHDDNPGVRLHAAKALAESGDARGFEAMKTMAGVPQLMVLYSLKSLEAPEATEIIIEMVGSGSINVHDEAHKQLYGRLDDRTLPLYLAALRHPNEQIRSRVIWVLGGTGCRKAVNALVKSMNEDQDELIRGYAARALGQIGDPSATPALIEALQHPYWAVRQASAESLEKITGQHFGQDADKWKAWYREKQHDRPSK
jgi:HEAT repeat protein